MQKVSWRDEVVGRETSYDAYPNKRWEEPNLGHYKRLKTILST